MLPFPPADEVRRRVPRLLGGLVLFGVGIALMVRADLGLAPWDVLHQGVSERTGIAIGNVTILTGVVVLLLWIPIRERPGLGTVLNVLVIGLVVDATLAVVDAPEPMWLRVAFLALGIFVFGPGSGLYIGAGLGPGPRDGLMTGLARRGRSVRVVRTGIELTALAVGALGQRRHRHRRLRPHRRPQRPLASRPHDPPRGKAPPVRRARRPPIRSRRSPVAERKLPRRLGGGRRVRPPPAFPRPDAVGRD